MPTRRPTPTIRNFDASRDRRDVRACFVELQDFERRLDPRIPAGESIADTYLELLYAAEAFRKDAAEAFRKDAAEAFREAEIYLDKTLGDDGSDG